MSQFSPARLDRVSRALDNNPATQVAEGSSGFLGGLQEVALRAPLKGVAEVSQDLGSVVNAGSRLFGQGDVFDENAMAPDAIDAALPHLSSSNSPFVRWPEALVSEGVRFAGESALLDPAVSGLRGAAIAKATGTTGKMAETLNKSAGLLKTVGNVLREDRAGVTGLEALSNSRLVSSIRLGAKASEYEGISLLQGHNKPEDESWLHYAATEPLKFLAMDAGLGVAGAALKKGFQWAAGKALPYLRDTQLGKAVADSAVRSQSAAVVDWWNGLKGLNEDQLQQAAAEGRVAQDMANKLIANKWDEGTPAFSKDGENRSAFFNQLVQATEGRPASRDTVEAVMAMHDAFAEMAVRTDGSYTPKDGTPIKFNSIDDYYRALKAQAAEAPDALSSGDAGTPAEGSVPQTSFRVDASGRESFYAALADAASTHKAGAAVEVKAPEFYNDPAVKLFLSPDKTAGAAVTPQGDLVSVFRKPGGADIKPILAEAAQHARTLDAFDSGNGKLPNLYSKFGFTPVARLKWNPEFAPPNWPESLGTPDVVFMVKDPSAEPIDWATTKDSVPVFNSYEEAKAAQEAAAPAPDSLNQAAPTGSIISGKEKLNVVGTGENGRITMADAAKALEDRQVAVRRFEAGDHSSEARRSLINGLKKEARTALTHEETARAIGWYSRQVNTMMDTLSQVYPEIKTDPKAGFVFRLLLATTSNGLEPKANLREASKLFEQWQSTGKFAGKPASVRGAVVEGTLTRVQNMIDSLGGDDNAYKAVADLFSTDMTAGEIFRQTGKSVPKEARDALLKGSMILGPKIGAFYSNLNGDFSFPTLDSWMYRQFNRFRGTLTGGPIKQEGGTGLWEYPRTGKEQGFFREAIQTAAKELSKERGQDLTVADLQAILWYHEKALYESLGIKGQSASRTDFAQAAQQFINSRSHPKQLSLGYRVGSDVVPGSGDATANGASPSTDGASSLYQSVTGSESAGVTGIPEGVPGPRGNISFNTEDGKALISLYQGADASTLFHESSHFFRRVLPTMSRDLADKANAWVGATSDTWTKAQEEQWATAFERYLSDGVSPTKNLGTIFEMTKAWMLETYRKVLNSPLQAELSPEIKGVFDNMLGGVSRPATPAEAGSQFADAVTTGIKEGLTPAQSLNQGSIKTINFNHFTGPDNTIESMKADAPAILKMVDAAVGDVQKEAEVRKLAEDLNTPELGGLLLHKADEVRQLAAVAFAGKMRYRTVAEDMGRLAQRILELDAEGRHGPEFDLLQKQFAERNAASLNIDAATYTIIREAARTTRMGNMTVDGFKEVKALLNELNGKDTVSLIIEKVRQASDESSQALKKGLQDLEAKRPQSAPDSAPAEAPAETSGESPGEAETAAESPGEPAEGAGTASEAPAAQPNSGTSTPAPAPENGAVGSGGGTTGGPATAPVTGNVSAPGNTPAPAPKGLTPTQRLLMSRIAQATRVGQAAKIAQIPAAAKASKLGAILELWTSGLISGVKTLSVKTFGDMSNTLLQPMAKAVGEIFALSSKNPIERGKAAIDALGLYYHLVGAASDMWTAARTYGQDFEGYRVAARSLMHETPWFDSQIKGVRGPQFTASTFGQSDTSAAGIALNRFGQAARFLSRPITAVDDIFTNLNYVAFVRSQATAEAKSAVAAGRLKADQIGQYVDQAVQMAFDRGGARADAEGSPLFDAAYRYAKDAGYKTPLAFGGGQALKELTNAHPWVRVIAPFVNIPMNIFRSALRMTPGVGFGEYAAESAFGKLTKEQLTRRWGEVVMGIGFWSYALHLANTGRLTGAGPTNPAEKKVLLASGWQPNSVLLTGSDGKQSYVALNRLGPVADVMSMAADASEIWGYTSNHEASQMATLLLQSFLRNATQKTYIAGISDFFQAVADPSKADGYLRRTISSVVPASVNQFATSSDDELHDARTILDSIKKRIPGLSSTLPPRRNILGEVMTPPGGYVPFVDNTDPAHQSMLARMVSPAAMTRKSTDLVLNELTALRHGILEAPRTIDGLDLSLMQTKTGQNVYDRYQELIGELKVGGMTVHQQLNALMSSPAYKALPPPPEDPTDRDNPRLKEAMRVLSIYRDAARWQLIREVPEIKQYMDQRVQQRTQRWEASSALLEKLRQ